MNRPKGTSDTAVIWLKKHGVGVVLGTLAFVAVLVFVGKSEAVHACVNGKTYHDADGTTAERSSHVRMVVISRHCWGVFLHENEGAIVGLGTVGLFLVTGFLAYYTFGLWSATQALVIDAKETAIANRADNDRIREVMAEQHAAMAAQEKALSRLADVTAESVKQLQRDYVAANRPRLVLRQIGYVFDENFPQVRYTLGNVGASAATIVESNITAWPFVKGGERPAFPPYGPERNAMGAIRIEAGHEFYGTYSDTPEELHLFIGDVAADNLDTMLLGYVLYVDDNGGKRRIGFCRKRVDGQRRFLAVDDPDYEFFY